MSEKERFYNEEYRPALKRQPIDGVTTLTWAAMLLFLFVAWTLTFYYVLIPAAIELAKVIT
jgi:hypothetical protein